MALTVPYAIKLGKALSKYNIKVRPSRWWRALVSSMALVFR